MTDLTLQKRLSASILSCGINKVWIDPEETEEVSKARSRRDLRSLVKDGYILKKPNAIHSHYRATRRAIEKSMGRHKGHGKRFGTKKARTPEKKTWINKIRGQRKILKELRKDGKIDKELYRVLYRQTKGNLFKSKAALKKNVEEVLKERKEQELEKMKKDEIRMLKISGGKKSSVA